MNQKALIYCRVSSKSQATDGHGLESQEARCRQYAEAKGYDFAAVFPDTITGGGDFLQRPGMVALLSFIDAQPDENFVVVFDDVKRASRDTRGFLDLRDAFRERGVRVESPNFSFDETPESEFVETVIAAQGALERKQNGRQVKQKMSVRARLGYWCHLEPTGYRFEKVEGHGKLMVRDEPLASIVQEGLEGYASGRFQTQAELGQFLQDDPRFPRGTSGRVGAERVSQLLQQPLDAGYINSEAYGLSWKKAQHEPLISLETYQKIQRRRDSKAKAPKRANIGDEFALRGVAVCACCEAPLRSSFSKGRHGVRYPYYLCQTRECEANGKSIKRDVLEDDVGAIVKRLEPAEGLTTLVAAMFRKAWDVRQAQAADVARVIKRQIVGIERDIEKTLDRLVDTSSQTVIRAFARKVDQLEKEKALLSERAVNQAQPTRSFEELLEPALAFLTSPWKLWESGEIALRRIVLKLAFAGRIKCCRNEGARSPKIAFPFKDLGAFCGAEVKNGGA